MAEIKLNIDAKQSAKTLQGLETQLDDMKTKLKGLEVGSTAFNKLKKEVVSLDSKVKNVNKSIEGLDFDAVAGEIGKFAGGVGAAFAGLQAATMGAGEGMEEFVTKVGTAIAIGQGIKGAIESITAAQKLLNVAMAANPIGLLIAGVVALTAAAAALTDGFGLFNSEIDAASDLAEKYNEELFTQKANLKLLENELNTTNISEERRASLIDKINKQYGEYLPALLDEKSSNEDIATALKDVNNNLEKKIRLQAAEERLVEIYKEQFKIQKQIADGPSFIDQLKGSVTGKDPVLDIVENLQDLQEEEKQLFDIINKDSAALEANGIALDDNSKKLNDNRTAAEKLNAERIKYQEQIALDAETDDEEEDVKFETTEERYKNLWSFVEKGSIDISKMHKDFSDQEINNTKEALKKQEEFRRIYANNVASIQSSLSTFANNDLTKNTAIGKGAALVGIGINAAQSISQAMILAGETAAAAGPFAAIAYPIAFASIAATMLSSIGAAKKTLKSVEAPKTKTIAPPKFADGGYVSGPGTSRSDSIAAQLSSGEYVVNAASTNAFRPLLESINNGGSMMDALDMKMLGREIASSISSIPVVNVATETEQVNRKVQNIQSRRSIG